MSEPLMQYIDINPIVEKAKELDCPFIAIIGGKGTGKTWGCVDYAVKHFFSDTGNPTEAQGVFYVLRSFCDKLVADAYRFMEGTEIVVDSKN